MLINILFTDTFLQDSLMNIKLKRNEMTVTFDEHIASLLNKII